MKNTLNRSPLKYPGAKIRVMPRILRLLPKKQLPIFIDACVGGGSCFLNVNAAITIAYDVNWDLINFYKQVQLRGTKYNQDAKALFTPLNNVAERYYEIRALFNACTDDYERAIYMLYLSRHCYNGLWRVNKSNYFNVPFGRYAAPYFPDNELGYLYERARTVEFIHGDFSQAYQHDTVMKASSGMTTVYLDPPYVKLSDTANFTSYSVEGFTHQDQLRLVDCAIASSKKGVTNIISNHYNKVTRDLYREATKKRVFYVSRTIGQNINSRKPVKEMLALYAPTN